MLDGKQPMPMQAITFPAVMHSSPSHYCPRWYQHEARTWSVRIGCAVHGQFADGSTPLVWRVCVYAGADLAHPELPRTLPANANYFEKVSRAPTSATLASIPCDGLRRFVPLWVAAVHHLRYSFAPADMWWSS